ncbi:hypothetical protein GGG16DRAFT_127402 [Schizophyllum commune]
MGATMSLAVLGRSRNTSIRVRREAAFARCADSSCRHLYTDEWVIFPATELLVHYYLFVSTDTFLFLPLSLLYTLAAACPGLVALTGSARKYERVLLTGCLALHTVCDGCYRIR